MTIPICLIEHFKENHSIRSLATFLYLKSRFSNSCYYGTDVRGLAFKLGISKSACAKYLKICKDLNLIRYDSGNTCFLRLGAICEVLKIKGRGKVMLNKLSSIKEIEKELNYLLFKNKSNQFNYIKKKTSDLVNPQGAYAHLLFKSARKFMRNRTKIGEMTEYRVSYKRIGLNLGVSVGTAYSIVSDLVKSGRLIKKSSFQNNGKIVRCMIEMFNSNKDQHFISNKLNIIKVQANEYVFL